MSAKTRAEWERLATKYARQSEEADDLIERIDYQCRARGIQTMLDVEEELE